jgi:hypothetical protein
VDASAIGLGEFLTQPGEGDIDHPITFATGSYKIHSKTTILQKEKDCPWYMPCKKLRHYLLGKHFKMFTDHSTLRYLVNKPVLGGRICIWLLLF